MAEAVKEIPNTAQYAWDEWIRLGAKYKLTKGEDFDVSLKTMACQIHTASKRRGLRATVRMVTKENAVYLEIYSTTDKPRSNRGRQTKTVATKTKPAKTKVTKKSAVKKPATPSKKKKVKVLF